MNSDYGHTNDGTARGTEATDVSDDQRHRTCSGTMHVMEAAKWVNFGQAAVAVVEMALFATLYLLIDPSVVDTHNAHHQTFVDAKYLTLGISLFAVNVFFACVLYAGIRFENVTMIVANLGWMTVSVALRGLSIVFLVVELVQHPGDAWWLGPTVVAATASLAIQCLSCYVLARVSSFMKDRRTNRRRLEALAVARLLVQHWMSPPPTTSFQQRHQQRTRPPPPSYEIATINVSPVVISCGSNLPRGADGAQAAIGLPDGAAQNEKMDTSTGHSACQTW